MYMRNAFLLLALPLCLVGQQGSRVQAPEFVPYHANGIYNLNDTVGWKVTMPPGSTGPGGPYTYTIKKNNFGNPIKTGSLDLTNGSATIEVTTDEPSMLFVQVSSPNATGRRGVINLGAAVAPTKIQPSTPRPADFDAFWDGKLQELAKVPVNVVLTPGETSRPGVEFATFMLDSLNSTARGYFAKPAKPGKYPAIVLLQWAGVYALPKNAVIDRARQGWLAINVDSHDKAPDDARGAPGNYNGIGTADREKSYFLNMYLRDCRAVDYITSRPEWDGKTLVVMGTSMGGQQSLCVAGLEPKVSHVIVNEPSGCDLAGPLHDRASGYPSWPTNKPEAVTAGGYFDAVNFASRIKATSLVAMGFVDTTAPPVGNWIAFNQIKGPKEAAPMFDSPHNNLATGQQQAPFNNRSADWLSRLVNGREVTLDKLIRP
jgi:cephalosporin-C deacetylase-like acetyl esterase